MTAFYIDLDSLCPSGLIHLRDALVESDLKVPEVVHDVYEANMGEAMPEHGMAPSNIDTTVSAPPHSFAYVAGLWQKAIAETKMRESEHGDLSEIIAHVSPFPAPILAQLIMQHLPLDAVGFPIESKTFWLQVAHHMGPDWITSLRRVAAFMDKAESF